MRDQSRSGGFTLIELLVVIVIIGALGALAVNKIVPALRKKDQVVSLDRLKTIDAMFIIYQDQYGSLPRESGPGFVLALWTSGIVDHTVKDAQMFFDPTMTGKANEDLSNLTVDPPPDGIDWTGPDMEQYRRPLRRQDRNANAKIIVCNRVPAEINSDDDLDALPHAGKGIAVLYLGGSTEFVPVQEFGSDHPIIGPDSPLEKFRKLVPDEY